ncbi:cytochrome P450 [Geopyxis carbonaria]|nr:cytochrome P450 [Geopyxis carbonaria]
MLLPSPAVAALSGVLVQRVLSGIQEVSTVGTLVSLAAAEVVLYGYIKHTESGIAAMASAFFVLNGAFFTSLLLATIVHRLFLHPLSKFPGPKLAGLSKLYEVSLVYRGINAQTIRKLHKEHGDVIRIGPDEVSINNVEAVALLGRQSYENRGPFYELASTIGARNLLTIRKNAVHRRWRGIWEQGFKADSLKDYAPRVEAHIDRFVEVIAKTAGKTLDVVPMCANMAFDVMADLSFGLPNYGMQDGTGDSTYMGFINAYMRTLAIIGSLRNICQLVPYLPQDAPTTEFKRKTSVMLKNRIAMGKTRKDIFSHLLGEDSESGIKFDVAQLSANAQLIIIAGADTTSNVTACALRELALNPGVQQKLVEELKNVGAPLDSSSTKGLPYLQAIIDETLRLWNPVPIGVHTVTGPTSVEVAGVTLPPHTVFRIHHLSLMTDERYFPDPETWNPDRWLDGGKGVKDIRAFIPFSYGPHVCVGKHLALTELRLAVARVVENFVVELPENHDDEEWKARWKDWWLTQIAGLDLRFQKRE